MCDSLKQFYAVCNWMGFWRGGELFEIIRTHKYYIMEIKAETRT